jgi:hypothetical protein
MFSVRAPFTCECAPQAKIELVILAFATVCSVIFCTLVSKNKGLTRIYTLDEPIASVANPLVITWRIAGMLASPKPGD